MTAGANEQGHQTTSDSETDSPPCKLLSFYLQGGEKREGQAAERGIKRATTTPAQPTNYSVLPG